MKVLKLIKEFVLQRMKESKTIKECSNNLLDVTNKIKIIGKGKEFLDSKLFRKFL